MWYWAAAPLLSGDTVLARAPLAGINTEGDATADTDAETEDSTANRYNRGAASRVTGITILPAEFPLRLLGFTPQSNYQRQQTLESWHFTSEAACVDIATRVLETLRAGQFKLVQAGFMDVSGESWGCVFTGAQGESCAITLVPEHPFSPRSSDNGLVVSFIHYLPGEVLR